MKNRNIGHKPAYKNELLVSAIIGTMGGYYEQTN